jgi:hypothetical protein
LLNAGYSLLILLERNLAMLVVRQRLYSSGAP